MQHPCMPKPTPPPEAKRLEKASLPAVDESPPKVIYIREVYKKDEQNEQEQKQQIANYKFRWWHLALAFVVGYSLATTNRK